MIKKPFKQKSKEVKAAKLTALSKKELASIKGGGGGTLCTNENLTTVVIKF